MQSIGLVLALHNTQPPGTSGHDLRRAFERAYFPMLDALDAHPAVNVSMHWSGQLLEWMELHAPERLDQLLKLVVSGRIEILGGLHGGAVLPSLPERDAVGQVQLSLRPPLALTALQLKAQVAWVRLAGEHPGMGLEFETDEAQRLKLGKLIVKLAR